MGRTSSDKGSSDDMREMTRGSSGSPKELKHKTKNKNKNSNNKPSIRSVENLNITVSMEKSHDQAVAGPSKEPVVDNIMRNMTLQVGI